MGDILLPTPDKVFYVNQNHTKRHTSLDNMYLCKGVIQIQKSSRNQKGVSEKKSCLGKLSEGGSFKLSLASHLHNVSCYRALPSILLTDMLCIFSSPVDCEL